MINKVLYDSDVLLDCILKREPHYIESSKALYKAVSHKINGFIASHSVLNIAYILRKNYSISELRSLLKELISYLPVISVDSRVIDKALDSDIKDLEDAVINYSAELNCVSCIITRNIDDYKNSTVLAVTPYEFNRQ